MNTKLILNGLLLALTISTTSCKNSAEENSQTTKIDSILNQEAAIFLKDSVVTSVSIGLYVKGKSYTQHKGTLDPGKNNTPTDSTLYEIASITKTFTGLLVAQAVLDGKFSVEDDVRNVLPEEYQNLNYNGEPIRVKHLLLHTAGLPAYLPTAIGDLMTEFTEELPFQISKIESGYTKDQFLQDVQRVELTATPGTNYAYSNVDVELLAYILERAYETTYDDLIRTYITAPADMDDTKIKLSIQEKSKLANGYGMNGRRTPHFANTLWGADGGLKSTSKDLTKYMEFILKSEHERISKSQELLYDEGDFKAGYLWSMRDTAEDGLFFRHHGGAFGTQNLLFIYPKYDLGISVITNQSDMNTAPKLEKLVADILSKLKKEINTPPSQEKQASAPFLQ